MSHGYVDDGAAAVFRFINPDYFRLVPWEGEGLKPVGYGYESIEAIVTAAVRVNDACVGSPTPDGLARRQEVLKQIDDRGIIATPANSAVNELVMEAGRLSILNDGRAAMIEHAPARVRLK